MAGNVIKPIMNEIVEIIHSCMHGDMWFGQFNINDIE